VIYSITDKIGFIESIFGTGKLARNSKNFDVRCPICDPKDLSKRKLAIRVADDALHCWTCGYKAHTLAPLIRKFGTNHKLIEYRDKYAPIDLNGKSKNISFNAPEEKLSLPNGLKMLPFTPQNDPDVRHAYQYLKSRNISKEDIWYYKLCISDEFRWRRRIIMPSFNSIGELNYFVGRAIDTKRKPKYDNPDVDKLPIIFNELNIDWSKQLVLCEGPFDLMKCTQNATSLLGSDLNEQSALFNKILLNSTPIALALDGDMWIKKTPRIVSKLVEYDIDVVVVDVRQWDDPGRMTKDEFKVALASAKHLEWTDTFKDRLFKVSQTSMSV
jgi:hypothetical protein